MYLITYLIMYKLLSVNRTCVYILFTSLPEK